MLLLRMVICGLTIEHCYNHFVKPFTQWNDTGTLLDLPYSITASDILGANIQIFMLLNGWILIWKYLSCCDVMQIPNFRQCSPLVCKMRPYSCVSVVQVLWTFDQDLTNRETSLTTEPFIWMESGLQDWSVGAFFQRAAIHVRARTIIMYGYLLDFK